MGRVISAPILSIESAREHPHTVSCCSRHLVAQCGAALGVGKMQTNIIRSKDEFRRGYILQSQGTRNIKIQGSATSPPFSTDTTRDNRNASHIDEADGVTCGRQGNSQSSFAAHRTLPPLALLLQHADHVTRLEPDLVRVLVGANGTARDVRAYVSQPSSARPMKGAPSLATMCLNGLVLSNPRQVPRPQLFS